MAGSVGAERDLTCAGPAPIMYCAGRAVFSTGYSLRLVSGKSCRNFRGRAVRRGLIGRMLAVQQPLIDLLEAERFRQIRLLLSRSSFFNLIAYDKA